MCFIFFDFFGGICIIYFYVCFILFIILIFGIVLLIFILNNTFNFIFWNCFTYFYSYVCFIQLMSQSFTLPSLYCCCTSFLPLMKIAWSYRKRLGFFSYHFND